MNIVENATYKRKLDGTFVHVKQISTYLDGSPAYIVTGGECMFSTDAVTNSVRNVFTYKEFCLEFETMVAEEKHTLEPLFS